MPAIFWCHAGVDGGKGSRVAARSGALEVPSQEHAGLLEGPADSVEGPDVPATRVAEEGPPMRAPAADPASAPLAEPASIVDPTEGAGLKDDITNKQVNPPKAISLEMAHGANAERSTESGTKGQSQPKAPQQPEGATLVEAATISPSPSVATQTAGGSGQTHRSLHEDVPESTGGPPLFNIGEPDFIADEDVAILGSSSARSIPVEVKSSKRATTVETDGPGKGTPKCPRCNGAIQSAHKICPHCSLDLRALKASNRKAELDALYERACRRGKHWDLTLALRGVKDALEDINARSMRSAQFAILAGYTTGTGKLAMEAFGIGRGGKEYFAEEGGSIGWNNFISGFFADELYGGADDQDGLGKGGADTPVVESGVHVGVEVEHSARSESVAALGQMLTGLGMTQYVHTFAKERVTMENVAHLTLEELKSGLHLSFGEAADLKHAVRESFSKQD